MITKYAIRALCPHTGQWLYRSSGWSDSFGEWGYAQLWASAKTAEQEAKRHRIGIKFHEPRPSCVVVAINIGEPA